MSAGDGIPRDLPPVIRFEDIQVGDTVRRVEFGLTVEGVVAVKDLYGATTEAGGWIAGSDPGEGGVLYLVNRPAPVEPTNLGAVVEAHTDAQPDRAIYVRGGGEDDPWWSEFGGSDPWDNLVNPEVKHEGWVQS